MSEAATAALRQAFAAAFSDAVLAGVDFHAAADLFQRLRTDLAAVTAVPAAADQITGVIAALPPASPLIDILMRFRDRWIGDLIGQWIESLRAALTADPAAGLEHWRAALAELVAEFRFEHARRIAEAALPLPAGLDPTPQQIARWCAVTEEGRWREVVPLFEFLGGPLTRAKLHRARALNMLAELDLVIRQDLPAAKAALTQAEALAPDDWRHLYVRGRIAIAESRLDDADALFERVMRTVPQQATGFAQRSQLCTQRDELDEAEELAQQAMRCPAFPSDGVLAQLDLYAKPAMFAIHRNEIEALVGRFRALHPSSGNDYFALIRAATAFGLNGDMNGASDWLDRAVAKQPDWTGAYFSRGYLRLSRGEIDPARADFDRVLATVPNDPDGLWALALCAESAADWPAMLSYAQATLAQEPGRRAEIADRLQSTATAISDSSPDPAVARAFYDGTLAIGGETFRASYCNLLGNLAYAAGSYAEAAEHYRAAIAADAQNARYHANLALALEAGAQPTEEAIAAAQRALELAPETAEFTTILRRLHAAQAYVARYGEAALKLKPDPSWLRLIVDISLVSRLVEWLGPGKYRLRQAFTDRVATIRAAIKNAYGFTLPGIQVRDTGDSTRPGWWALEFSGASHPTAQPDPSITLEHLLDAIERTLRLHLPSLVGLHAARELAGACLDAPDLDRDPARLVAIARNARALLAERGRIVLPDDRTALLREAWIARAQACAAAAEAEHLVVATHDGAAPSDMVALQASAHQHTGVVIPAATLQADGSLAPNTCRVTAEPQGIVAPLQIDVTSPDAAEAALAPALPALLGAVALRWQLEQVRIAHPDTVAAAEAVLSEADLLDGLRRIVAAGGSVLPLSEALERLMLGADAEVIVPALDPEVHGARGPAG